MDNSEIPSQEELNKQLFFGSPSQLVHLIQIKSRKQFYKKEDFINKLTNQSIISTLKYRFPQIYLGKDYENLVLPCVSASEIFSKRYDCELDYCDFTGNDIINQGLIKVPEQTEIKEKFKAYQSGKRSAIIKWKDNQYYRLKGCGNLNQGFPIEPMNFPKKAIDIRGCQFKHTAIRELFMTEAINTILNKEGFQCANVPKGLWIYDNLEFPEILKNELILVDKCCSVFRVLGEKRFGCHLMPGLEIILAEMSKKLKLSLDNKEVFNFFPSERVISKDGSITIIPTSEMIDYIEILDGERINVLYEKYNIYQKNLLVDLFKLNIDSSFNKENNALIKWFDENFTEILISYMKSNNIYQELKEIITEKSFKDLLKKMIDETKLNNISLLEVFGLLYSRLGYECGKLKRIFQDNNINWGTYEDQPYRIHGNAHLDNFVILPKDTSNNLNRNLLSPLDFDLAFFKENFINIRIDMESEKYGKPDDGLFDLYFNVERQYLEWELAGMENFFIRDKYKIELSKDKEFSLWFDFFITLVRDTVVHHYQQGYLNRDYPYSKQYGENYNLLYNLIDISLMISNGIIG